MKRRRNSGLRKERIIMLSVSVLVLAALTTAGLYLRDKAETDNDGYVIDFTAIEKARENLEEKNNSDTSGIITEENLQLAEAEAEAEAKANAEANAEKNGSASSEAKTGDTASSRNSENSDNSNSELSHQALEDDLDYDPYAYETDPLFVEGEDTLDEGSDDVASDLDTTDAESEDELEEVQPVLSFSSGDNLQWPIVGNVLINFSMDKTVYFQTLEQYKCNPAIIIEAEIGKNVTAAASGEVTKVFTDPVIGNGMVVNIGNGYEITYAQIENLQVVQGDYVEKGQLLGYIAAPTKYYSVEGSNLYLMLEKDGVAVNPLTKLE